MAAAPQQFCVRWNSYHTNLQAVFPRLLLTEQFADVTLACESRQLRCHKLVLSACSAYLERLLLHNPCDHPIVLMRDMRFSEMQALVDFMYKGEVNVTQEELPSLLKSAEALQIRATPNHATPNGHKKRKSEERPEVKEETVEEDGLYYGELDPEHMEYNEDEEPGKPGSSLGQTSGRRVPYIRVKPESELFFQNKLQSLAKANSEYISRLSKMNPSEMRNEFSKYGFNTNTNTEDLKSHDKSENDYYKSWLEQNGELEVSLLKAGQKKMAPKTQPAKSEVELIPKSSLNQEKTQIRRRGRPPLFKDKNLDIGETVLKSDLDQFLEGKEVSSSGLSRKDLERVMMGKFNPNRRYSNEAMWAALMDVKKGGSIYRAAQTHKVPRKSLRNWMKRCHIKSSFPMPQQLKQFVENSKKQKEYNYQNIEKSGTETDAGEVVSYDTELEFGKHFLMNTASSEDEKNDAKTADNDVDDDAAINMSLHE
ncbi:uncharacterized protein LOC135085635 [Ostrinia nubilalis]|uniref:uncharacterized protein LOC135085635 n=1 Tax=Ostrinia nubilalis TaxID=29057 RepID=UPI0030824AA7